MAWGNKIMTKLTKWLNKQVSMFVLATANVEKDMLSQKEPNAEDINHVLNISQGTLADDLKRGIISESVIELRWRMYETINRTQELKSRISHYIKDADGIDVPVYETREITAEDNRRLLSKIKLDKTDNYPLEFVIDNSPITLAGKDIDDMEMSGEIKKIINKEGDEITEYGKVKNDDFNIKQERPIKIERYYVTKFFIEQYANKLHIRTINEEEKLLEFVFNKYADVYDKRSTLFISELKKVFNNPKNSILDINVVSFITNNSLGIKDFLEFHYEIIKFDKIIEFEGTYIIKYTAKPIINGVSIIDKYKGGKLEEKYRNKEARKTL